MFEKQDHSLLCIGQVLSLNLLNCIQRTYCYPNVVTYILQLQDFKNRFEFLVEINDWRRLIGEPATV